MSSPGQQTADVPFEITKTFIIDRKSIGFFKAILESYEDVAIFSVLDGKSGFIKLFYPHFFEMDLMAIIEDMKNYGCTITEVPDVRE